LAAALGYALATRARAIGVSAAAGLLLTGWYKRLWGDELFFIVSCLAGFGWVAFCLSMRSAKSAR
jgi:hypothetical protein